MLVWGANELMRSTVYAQLSQVSCGTGDLIIIKIIMSVERNHKNWLWV